MQISYHFALTKIQKLQNLKKKKKNFFFLYRLVLPKLAGTAGIFSDTKQGGYTYRFACRYGIFRLYRPVRYEIDSLNCNGPNRHMVVRILDHWEWLWNDWHIRRILMAMFSFSCPFQCMSLDVGVYDGGMWWIVHQNIYNIPCYKLYSIHFFFFLIFTLSLWERVCVY